MCNMTLVSSQHACKLECQLVILPTGHPVTFPLFFCLMGLKLQEQFHETLSSRYFSEQDCSCVAAQVSISAHHCYKLTFGCTFKKSLEEIRGVEKGQVRKQCFRNFLNQKSLATL